MLEIVVKLTLSCETGSKFFGFSKTMSLIMCKLAEKNFEKIYIFTLKMFLKHIHLYIKNYLIMKLKDNEFTFEELAKIAAENGFTNTSKRLLGGWAKDNGYIKKSKLITVYVKANYPENEIDD